MRVAIATLGCKVNQYDTAVIEKRFDEEGWRLVGVAGGAAHLHHDCAGERELPLGMTGAMALLWADGGGLP